MKNKILHELEIIRQKYLNSATEIKSCYSGEIGTSTDYEGRQIYELIQNAEDASNDLDGKLCIEFDGEYLSVSNTGNPFSFEGVLSLLYPNASTKSGKDTIGCKGLGFRSILTWAENITISSGDFTIFFSKECAAEFLENIFNEKPSLRIELEKYNLKEKYPVAILTCPKIIENSVLKDNFSTTIKIKCRKEVCNKINKQISSLQFEELIFLKKLSQIEIITSDKHCTFVKVLDEKEVSIEIINNVTNEKSEVITWNIFKKTVNIENNSHEFILAYDMIHKYAGNVLYSYFKTDIKLNFPAYIHGTFELTSNRNSLQKENKTNEILIQYFSDFMIESAVKISELKNECSYEPLELIITAEDDLGVLQSEYQLGDLLKIKAKKQRIFPTIQNTYVSIDDNPKYSIFDFASVLNPKVFVNFLKFYEYKEVDDFLIDNCNLKFYEYKDFCNLLNSDIDYYSIEEKITLIDLIEEEFCNDIDDEIFPHLMIDLDGDNICDSSMIYLYPSDELFLEIPSWVNIRFLNKDFENKLEEFFHLDRRSLVKKLKRYNVEEYSFEKLLQNMIKKVGDDDLSNERCSDIVKWLWNYYLNQGNFYDLSNVKVKVICDDGSLKDANKCYIGKEFGNELGERLISIFNKDSFVSKKNLGFVYEDQEKIINFLKWLGCSEFPRIINKKIENYIDQKNYVDYCRPLIVDSETEYSCYSTICSVQVSTIENIDQIFANSNFNDLISWIIIDSKISENVLADTEKDSKSFIEFIPNRTKTYKVLYFRMKSYLRFLFTRSEWIKDIEDNKKSPKYCCFEDNELSPLVIAPNIDYEIVGKIVGRPCKKEIQALLNKLGVSDTFQEMDCSVVYEVLLNLPELDPKFKKAKSLYRKLIYYVSNPKLYVKDNINHSKFIKEGKVVAICDGKKDYIQISKVKYANNLNICKDFLNNFYIFDINHRMGKENVKILFGINPIEYLNVQLDGEPQIHTLNNEFRKEYQNFIPFVYACRIEQNNSKYVLEKLKKTKVLLCSDINIKYEFENAQKVNNLGMYEFLYLDKSKVAYIKVPNYFETYNKLKKQVEFQDTVAEVITAICNVVDGKGFYRDLFGDSNYIREYKMRTDRGDDNLELLNEARKQFNMLVNPKNEFWFAIAKIRHLSNTDSIESIIQELGVFCSDEEVLDYENLSSIDTAENIIELFKKINIDVDDYNNEASSPIDITSYWKKMYENKKQKYINKFKAYLVDLLKNDEQCIEKYENNIGLYNLGGVDNIQNSINVNIDNLLSDTFKVTFTKLDEYNDNDFEDILNEVKSSLSSKQLQNLEKKYSEAKLEASIVFGKTEEFSNNDNSINSNQNSENLENEYKNKITIPDFQPTGFSKIDLCNTEKNARDKKHCQNSKNVKRTFSEKQNETKQDLGALGEEVVYRNLREHYGYKTDWVSGNAEKKGNITRGDDTCGYDMLYIDANGDTQYVEVKTSTNKEISFFISDSELKFALAHPKNYRIIFVFINDENQPVVQDLGNLFGKS